MSFFITSVAWAGQTRNDPEYAANRVESASSVISAIMNAEDKAIPRELLKRAEAVVVFPSVTKAAFMIGGQGGTGVAIRRVGDGWSAPAFLRVSGGSFGAQIGASQTDYVMLIMNKEGLSGLLNDRFEMGGEASIVAGPVGRTAAASTNLLLDAQILTYSRSKGLFAGASLKGMVITHQNDLNQAVYKRTAREVLNDPVLRSSDIAAPLRQLETTLDKY